MSLSLQIEQVAFDPLDPGEEHLFNLDVEFEDHISFLIEADFEEEPAHWLIAYGYLKVPILGVDEEIPMESSVTEVLSEDSIEKILNMPVTRWTW